MVTQVPTYHIIFTKANGDRRDMKFCYLHDIPSAFLKARVIGHDRPLDVDKFRVWDVEADGGQGNFRIITKSGIIVDPIPTGHTHPFETPDPV